MKSKLTDVQKAARAEKMEELMKIVQFCNDNDVAWGTFRLAAEYKFAALNGVNCMYIGTDSRGGCYAEC